MLLGCFCDCTGRFVSNLFGNHIVGFPTRWLIPFSAPLSSTITPATQVIDSGETATFNCTVQGNPIKMVEWFKDGELLADDERIIYQSSTLLHINDVQRKDQGMYQCFITDGKEEVQGTSQLLLGG